MKLNGIMLVILCAVFAVGCKHSGNSVETELKGGTVKVFPLANKMMYQKSDADYVAAVSLAFTNKTPVYVKMRPRYTHRVVIVTAGSETAWLYNEAGFVQLADEPGNKVFKIKQPELISQLFYNKN